MCDAEILSLGRISFRVLWPSRGVLPMVPFATQNVHVAGVNLKGDDIGVLRAVSLRSATNPAVIVNLNGACPWPPCDAIGYQPLVVSERRFF